MSESLVSDIERMDRLVRFFRVRIGYREWKDVRCERPMMCSATTASMTSYLLHQGWKTWFVSRDK